MTPRRILVVGSGAREHALCWRLTTEPGVERVVCAPGNPLIEDVAETHPQVASTDLRAIVELARLEAIDLVVVGPEAPLVAGLADALARAGVRCFGPGAAAAALEGSKAFARQVCAAAGVPMARGAAFTDAASAIRYAAELGAPLVVKADGLAGGKGVAVCATLEEVRLAIRHSLVDGRFGSAGRTVVVEEFLDGREASVIAICDSRTALLLPAARDHKRLRDGDDGPNTGGMGAYSPVPELDEPALEWIGRTVHAPVLAEMARRGTPFRGALFAGLMLTTAGPRVLEFNVRLGDPEAQALLPRINVPLAPLLAAAAVDRLADAAAEAGIRGTLVPASTDATVAVTLAAAGYPDAPRTGDEIRGIPAARATGALVFGAGLASDAEGRAVTAGGRVLTVVGRGPDGATAATAAYAAADLVEFEGRQLRRDIGERTPVLASGSAA